MNRNLNVSASGSRICGTPKVGVLASEIPTGLTPAARLLGVIDAGFPNRRYRDIILTGPGGGATLLVDENSAWALTTPGDGTYSGIERIEKYDDAVGMVASNDTAYSYQVGGITSDLVATYSITAAVSSDLAAAYSLAGSVAQDLVAAYAIVTEISADLSATWQIGDGVSADLAGAYSISAWVSGSLVVTYYIGDSASNSLISPTGRLPLQNRAPVYLTTRS